MAKAIGLSRNLKLSWLNKTVQLIQSDLSEQELKENLNEYLSFEISSPTNIRKTREILMNVWFYRGEYTDELRDEALSLIAKYPDCALEIHWIMLLAAYPVFDDICRLISKISEFQIQLTLSSLKQKLFDEWGERTTIFHSTDKIITTLKSFDVLVCDKPGKYQIKKHIVRNKDICAFMVAATMLIKSSSSYTFQELNSLDVLFPFEYKLEIEDIMQDNRFVINNHGGERSITLKNF